jgi:hypothetical protein
MGYYEETGKLSFVSAGELHLTILAGQLIKLRFQVLTVPSMKMPALWAVALCSLMEVDQRFRGVYCFHIQGDCL